MRNLAIGARLRKVAQVIGRKPPASEREKELRKIFRDLERHDTEMSNMYQETTHIVGVRTYSRQLIHNAVAVKHDQLGTHWVCGHCRTGDLGFNPHVGDYCPSCQARIEEIIRRKNYKAAG